MVLLARSSSSFPPPFSRSCIPSVVLPRDMVVKYSGFLVASEQISLCWDSSSFPGNKVRPAAQKPRGQLSRWQALEMTIHAHNGWVISVTFSPDRKHIASISSRSRSPLCFDQPFWRHLACPHAGPRRDTFRFSPSIVSFSIRRVV
jgi:WD40 repeat protein